MAADYRNFKTPFYEIEIGDSSGKKLVKLPHHILRLVEKVEIVETFAAGQFSTINLSIVEGSREPASPDRNLGTDGLYKIPTIGQNPDMDIAGSITNRVGSVIDLRFSGNGGITFLTEEEKKTGTIDRSPQENINGKIVTRSHKKEQSRPVFLFQERNQIKVTWGYVEDPSSLRSIRGYIIMCATSYPESGMIVTTITCQDTRSALDQIAPSKGIPFGRRKSTSKGNSIVIFEDLKTDEMLKEIADKAGMAAIISKDLIGDTVDSDKQKMWIAGESFHQFMIRLADKHNAYYSVYPDPKTGQDVLVFIKKIDLESRLVIKDTDLTTYKAPGSILKSVDIKCDYGGVVGNLQKGVDNAGVMQGRGHDIAQVVQFKNDQGKVEQVVPNSPVDNGNPVPAALGLHNNVANGETTGTVNINPSNSVSRLDGVAQSSASDSSRNVLVEFTSLGYTKFSPGVIDIRNIGVRYSGKYRLQTVTHTIDSSGYITKGTAMSQSLPGGGVSIPDAVKPNQPKKVDVQQFKPDPSVADQHYKRTQVDK